jgi:hypothetical protein
MQKTMLIYPLIACLVLLNSCSDNDGCSEKEPESYPLSQQYKGLICYSGFDTLRFLSEKNETITFIGQGRKDYEYSEIVGSPDCTYKKIYGGQSIRFSNNMGDDVIDLWYDSKGEFFVELYNNQKDFSGKFSYPYKLFTRSDIGDTLLVNSKKYANTFRFGSLSTNQDTLNYSKDVGILRIKLYTGETFGIIK